MTTAEFSNEFDTLLNNFINTEEFGKISNIKIDEYEKSVFLTSAQEDIVLDLYTGKNPFNDSFEKTEEVRRYLNNLIKTYTTEDKLSEHRGLAKTSVFFKTPEDMWFIIYESVNFNEVTPQCANKENIQVIPIKHDEYHRIKNNPFRRASKNKVFRFDINDNIVEIVSEFEIDSYYIRYLSRPTPIILTDLPDNLTIGNKRERTDCILNPVLHKLILDKAVRAALLSRSYNTANH